MLLDRSDEWSVPETPFLFYGLFLIFGPGIAVSPLCLGYNWRPLLLVGIAVRTLRAILIIGTISAALSV